MKMKREEKIMGKMRYGVVIVLLFALVGISTIMNCSRSIEEKKEVLIYCGITMIKPMSDIARIIEEIFSNRLRSTRLGISIFRALTAILRRAFRRISLLIPCLSDTTRQH
jgi:hypothetical protein